MLSTIYHISLHSDTMLLRKNIQHHYQRYITFSVCNVQLNVTMVRFLAKRVNKSSHLYTTHEKGSETSGTHECAEGFLFWLVFFQTRGSIFSHHNNSMHVYIRFCLIFSTAKETFLLILFVLLDKCPTYEYNVKGIHTS